MDMDFYVLFGAVGIFYLSPLWVTVALFLKWKKIISRHIRFVVVVGFILCAALIIVMLAVNSLANFGIDYFYISGNDCKPNFVCKGFNFLYRYKAVLWSSIYILFLIGFIVMAQVRKPKWLGFCEQ